MYEMHSLQTHRPEWTTFAPVDSIENLIPEVLRKATSMGVPAVPPVIITFTDVDRARSPGEYWRRALQKEGYVVESIPLGVNPKSNHKIKLYLWFTNKNKAKDDEKNKNDTDIPGRAEGQGNPTVPGAVQRRGSGYLRSRRRA